MLDAEKDAIEIDGNLSSPVGERHIDHWTGEADPGVVDENVEPAEPRFRFGYYRLPVVLKGHVVMKVFCVASIRAQFAQQALAVLVLQVGGDDPGALARQHNDRAAADPVGGAGHQRDLAFDPPLKLLRPAHARSSHGPIGLRSWKRFHN